MSDSPRPQDYATLNVVHSALLAGTALLARRRGRGQPLSTAEMAQLSLAAFSVAKAVSREKIGSWVREPFTDVDGAGEPEPVGGPLRRAVGELVTCSRCVGAWSALSLVGLRTASPVAGQVATTVFATAGANDFLQAGFRLLCNVSNDARRRAETPDYPVEQPS
jgi:Protein of unknown function (DUF1360)